jgi:hypothetical protein
MRTDKYNPATRPSNELNDFTDTVRIFSNGWGNYWVKLRDGSLVRPYLKEAEDETCEDVFFADGYRYCWNLDGTSVTSRHYDMMELVVQ